MNDLRTTTLYHACEISVILEELATDLQHGLNEVEAQRRLAQFGANQLQWRKQSEFEEFFEIFTEPMFLLLIAASVVYGLLGQWRDAIAMLVVLIPIAGVEFLQEFRVERALEVLEKLTSPTARVRRDGQEKFIPASQVVVGDVILLGAGDRIPADGRLVESVNLRVDESALTGESLSVDKDASIKVGADAALADRTNLVFAGTMVVGGRATATVVATGMQTEIGRVAALAQKVKESKTPLQRRMKQIALWFGGLGLTICALVAGWGIAQGKPLLDQLLVGISLAMAAIPEALPILSQCSWLSVRGEWRGDTLWFDTSTPGKRSARRQSFALTKRVRSPKIRCVWQRSTRMLVFQTSIMCGTMPQVLASYGSAHCVTTRRSRIMMIRLVSLATRSRLLCLTPLCSRVLMQRSCVQYHGSRKSRSTIGVS
jgi:hypothetical protein